MSLPSPFGDLKTLVLAGSNAAADRSDRDPSPKELPLVDKAFLRLRGRLVIEYVLDCLRECGLARIWVLGPAAQLARIPGPLPFIAVPQPPGARFFDNLATAAPALHMADNEPILLVFGDHPLITPTALRVFLARCAESIDEVDFFHAMALRPAYREYLPWFERTSMHMREMTGRATGLSLVIPSRLHGLDTLQQLYDVRKLERLDSFIGLLRHLARWLGADAPRGVLDSVLLYVAKEMEAAGRGPGGVAAVARRLEAWSAARVPVKRLERYAVRVLGAERGVRLVPMAQGGLAIDVDFAEELEALERHWDALREITARQDASMVEPSR